MSNPQWATREEIALVARKIQDIIGYPDWLIGIGIETIDNGRLVVIFVSEGADIPELPIEIDQMPIEIRRLPNSIKGKGRLRERAKRAGVLPTSLLACSDSKIFKRNEK